MTVTNERKILCTAYCEGMTDEQMLSDIAQGVNAKDQIQALYEREKKERAALAWTLQSLPPIKIRLLDNIELAGGSVKQLEMIRKIINAVAYQTHGKDPANFSLYLGQDEASALLALSYNMAIEFCFTKITEPYNREWQLMGVRLFYVPNEETHFKLIEH